MICNTLKWSIMFVVVLVVGCNCQALARSAEGLTRIEKLLSSDAPSLPFKPSPLAALIGTQSMSKRSVLDLSCKGIYDREYFRKLDRICEDCYNLYRKPYVAVDCRNNCYANEVFQQCLFNLKEPNHGRYFNLIRIVGK